MTANPKLCTCGKQGRIVDSRKVSEYVARRYVCACGTTWGSAEFRLDEASTPKQMDTALRRKYSSADRDYVADRLIELAQELLR